jgi:hypothetical protein
MTPRRFQRRRIKGYRLPPGIICVTHQTKWGNPHNWKTSADQKRCDAMRRLKVRTRNIERLLAVNCEAATSPAIVRSISRATPTHCCAFPMNRSERDATP